MKISCIVLGAGLSSRFGSDKLLQSWQGKSILEHTIEKVSQVDFHEIILVTSQTIKDAIIWSSDIQVVVNTKQQLGVSHSIELGISQAKDADAYLFIVGDQPLLSLYTLNSFVTGFKASGYTLGCVKHDARMGNPTIFSHIYKGELLALEGDVGGKSVMKKHLDKIWFYEIESESELVDIDTIKDYKLICK